MTLHVELIWGRVFVVDVVPSDMENKMGERLDPPHRMIGMRCGHAAEARLPQLGHAQPPAKSADGLEEERALKDGT